MGLISGIFCLVLFVNINLYSMSNSNDGKPKNIDEVVRQLPKEEKLTEKALKPKPLPSALTPNGPTADSSSDNRSKTKK